MNRIGCIFALRLARFVLVALAAFLLGAGSASAAYYYSDNSAAVAAAYPWVDVSLLSPTPGTPVPLGDDTVSGAVNLGFTFNFGGTNYTQLRIGSNGMLFFSGTSTAYTNAALPLNGASGKPNIDAVMLPFWDDLHPASVGTRIMYRSFGTAPNRYFVVSYLAVPHYPAIGSYTFQVQIFENGKFVYRYGSTSDSGASATVGVEVSNTDQSQYSFNTASVPNGRTILWQRTPVAVAEYRFDDLGWCSPASALDTVGGHNGTLIGGVTWQDSPVSGGKPVNGAAAGIYGGAIDITGLPLDTTAGYQNSISFWMYWDGTPGVMPLGFGLHDLWLSSSSFGFNSFNSDIFGISWAGLANGWHHVAVVFTNGNLTANKMWIDGVAQTLTQRAGTPNNGNAVVNSHMRLSGVWGSGGYRFSGMLDRVRVYTGTLNQTQVDADRAASNPAVVCPPPPPPTLVTHYRLDDNWDVTHSTVNAVAGGPAGTINAPYASKVPTPAFPPGKPNTCSGAVFSAATGSMRSTGVSLDLTGGAKNSVSFWMYWTGGNSQMPFGFAVYDLWIQGGSFGFNTASSDIYGISSAGLANGWHHVAAVFTNANVAANKLWIDGVPQALTQRMGTPNNASAYANNTFQLSSWTNDNNYRFGGTLDELKVYRGALTDALVLADYAATCPSASLPFGFNCVEPGADALAGHLYTKLAGTAFNIDVVALRDSNGDNVADAVETTYASDANKNVTVELVDGSGAVACASRTALTPAVSQALTFAQANQATEQGRKAASFTVSKTYPDLRCRVTDANQAPSIVACSTDNFAVRPSAVTLNVLPVMATPPSASAAPVIKAGTAFTLTATTSPVASYAGTLNQDGAKLTAQVTTQDTVVQNGGVVGVLSPATLTANAAPVNNASYAEAGYLYLAPGAFRDDSLTAVDLPNDCVTSTVGDAYLSDAFVGGKIGCSIGNKINYSFGRFIPDHFALTPGVATPACNSVPTPFTYFGQDGFTTTFTLTAQNAANATTQNYSSVFGRLVLNVWNNFGFTAPLLPAGSTLSASATVPTGVWTGGVANVVAVHQASRAATPVNPVNLVVNALPVDPDGVTMPAALAVAAATELRYGRASLKNAHGSNLLDMPMPFRAEYWLNGWRLNTADTCTGDETMPGGAANAVTVALATVAPAVWATCVWDSSAPGLSGAGCASAGAAGRRYLEGATPALVPPFAGDFNLWLRASGAGNVGSVVVTPTVPAWLGLVPPARATFGTYKTPVIYRREVY